MWCSVCNCKNNNNKPLNSESVHSFFTFPKNQSLLKQWILFCKRKDKFNWKTAKICFKHFVKEDFVNYLQYEMGLADRLQLKPGSVPKIYIICEDEIKESERAERMNVRKNKNLVGKLLEQTNVVENKTSQFDVQADVEPEEDWKLKYNEMSSINNKIQLEIDHLNTEKDNEIPRQWTNDETKLLIKTRLNHEFEFSQGRRKKSVLWSEVLQDIKNNNENFPFDRMDINKKFLNLMITYKRIIKRNMDSGRNSTTWEYFDDFDNVYKWNQVVIEEKPQEYFNESVYFEEFSVDEPIGQEPIEIQPPKRKRKNNEILDFLSKEAEEEERRHKELVNIEREKIEIEKKRLKLLNSLVNILQSIDD